MHSEEDGKNTRMCTVVHTIFLVNIDISNILTVVKWSPIFVLLDWNVNMESSLYMEQNTN